MLVETTMARTTEHKEGRATVKVVYYTHKTLKDGSHPFLVRITKNRKNRYISTGLSLLPQYWNKAKSEVRRTYPEPLRDSLKKELRKWEDKYREAANHLALADEVHDVQSVATKAIEGRKQTRRVQLLAYMDELVKDLEATQKIGNAVVYRDLSNQLIEFIKVEFGTKDLAFQQVNVAFCYKLETYLRTRGNTENTLSNRFRTLRAVWNKAIASGVAKVEAYPFSRNAADRHKFSVSKFDTTTTKRAISREEIRRLESYEPTNARLQLAKDVFLFSYYGAGINFVDLAQLKWSNFGNNADEQVRMNYVRQKTGGKFSLKTPAPTLAIIDFYRPVTYSNAEAYVFPVLQADRHKTPKQIKNRLHKVLGQINQNLKIIAKEVGIEVPLTTYVARHSFATSLKKAGVATAIISEAMGHKSEAVTVIYLDSFEREVVDTALTSLL